MSNDTTIAKVTAMVAPLLADLKLELYDVEFRGGTLRVTIDTPPGSPAGVDLDQLSLVTRLLSRDLDHDDPMPGHYTLEVTSPGVERSLRTPAHYRREVGKEVAIRLRDTAGGDRRVSGVLVAADDDTITVRPAAADAAAAPDADDRVIPIAQIDRAKTVFVWGPAPKPGKGPSKGPGKAPSRGPGKAATDRGGARTSGHSTAQTPTLDTTFDTTLEES